MTKTHEAFLDHPIVHAYVSLRVWGNLARQDDVVQAEIRARTVPGDRIFSISCRSRAIELTLAESLPDRSFEVVDPDRDRAGAAQREAKRRGLENVRFRGGDPANSEPDAGAFKVVLSLYSMHRLEPVEDCWGVCHRAAHPEGTLLAQEYVGPNRLAWAEAQVDAANHALRHLVPEHHRPHHDRVGDQLAATLRRIEPSLASQSRDLIPTCRAAGFEITAAVGAGCSLLHPVLAHQIDSYDPANWDHNLVLSGLCREEDRLIRDGILGDDFVMFVATPARR